MRKEESDSEEKDTSTLPETPSSKPSKTSTSSSKQRKKRREAAEKQLKRTVSGQEHVSAPTLSSNISAPPESIAGGESPGKSVGSDSEEPESQSIVARESSISGDTTPLDPASAQPPRGSYYQAVISEPSQSETMSQSGGLSAQATADQKLLVQLTKLVTTLVNEKSTGVDTSSVDLEALLIKKTKFNDGIYTKAEKEVLKDQTEFSLPVKTINLHHDTVFKNHINRPLQSFESLRKQARELQEAPTSFKAKSMFIVEGYQDFLQGKNDYHTFINTYMSKLYETLKTANLNPLQFGGFQFTNPQGIRVRKSFKDVKLSSVGYEFLTKPYPPKASWFENLDNHTFIEPILGNPMNADLLQLHSIPVNLDKNDDIHQPPFMHLTVEFMAYRSLLFKKAALENDQTMKFAPLCTMIPGSPQFDPMKHLDLTDFNITDETMKASFSNWLINNLTYLQMEDKVTEVKEFMKKVDRIDMGCKTFTLATWVSHVFCGKQRSSLINLIKHRDGMLNQQTGAFSKFPQLDPLAIFKCARISNEKIGELCDKDGATYISHDDLLFRLYKGFAEHVNETKWRGFNDESNLPSVLCKELFKIAEALNLHMATYNGRNAPHNLARLRSAHPDLPSKVQNISDFINLLEGLYSLHGQTTPRIPDKLATDLDRSEGETWETMLYEARSDVIAARTNQRKGKLFAMSDSNSIDMLASMVEDSSSCSYDCELFFALDPPDLDTVYSFLDQVAFLSDEELDNIDEQVCIFSANSISVFNALNWYFGDDAEIVATVQTGTPGAVPKGADRRRQARMRVRSRVRKSQPPLNSTSSFSDTHKKVVDLSSSNKNLLTSELRKKNNYLHRMRGMTSLGIPKATQQVYQRRRPVEVPDLDLTASNTSGSSIDKFQPFAQLQKYLHESLRDGHLDSIDPARKQKITELQKAAYQMLRSLNSRSINAIIEQGNTVRFDISGSKQSPEDSHSLTVCTHKEVSPEVSPPAELVLTLNECGNDDLDSVTEFASVSLTEDEMADFRL